MMSHYQMSLNIEYAVISKYVHPSKQWRRQPSRNGGDEGGSVVRGCKSRKNFWDQALFYARKRPLYRQGTLLICNSTLRSSETVNILGFLMTNVANKATCLLGTEVMKLVSTSHSEVRHKCSCSF